MTDPYDLVMLDLLEKSHKYGEMTLQFEQVLHALAVHVIQKKFPGTEFLHEDMVAQAMLDFTRTWHKFNVTKSSKPYSFFRICAHSSGLQVLCRDDRERRMRKSFADPVNDVLVQDPVEILIKQEEQQDEKAP